MTEKESRKLINKSIGDTIDSFIDYANIVKYISYYYPVSGNYKIKIELKNGNVITVDKELLKEIENSVYAMVDNIYSQYEEALGRKSKKKKEGEEGEKKYTGFTMPLYVQDVKGSSIVNNVMDYISRTDSSVELKHNGRYLTSRNNLASMISIYRKDTKPNEPTQASVIRKEMKDYISFEKVEITDEIKGILESQKNFITHSKQVRKSEVSPRKSKRGNDQITISGGLLDKLNKVISKVDDAFNKKQKKYITARAILSRIILAHLMEEQTGNTIKQADQFLRDYMKEDKLHKSELVNDKTEYDNFDDKKKSVDNYIKTLKSK